MLFRFDRSERCITFVVELDGKDQRPAADRTILYQTLAPSSGGIDPDRIRLTANRTLIDGI